MQFCAFVWIQHAYTLFCFKYYGCNEKQIFKILTSLRIIIFVIGHHGTNLCLSIKQNTEFVSL